MVILEAVNDLDSNEIEILRDEKDEPMRSKSGRIIRYNIGKDALDFLSGKNKMLFEVARDAEVNATAIIKSLKELGPKELKKRFMEAVIERGDNVTEQF